MDYREMPLQRWGPGCIALLCLLYMPWKQTFLSGTKATLWKSWETKAESQTHTGTRWNRDINSVAVEKGNLGHLKQGTMSVYAWLGRSENLMPPNHLHIPNGQLEIQEVILGVWISLEESLTLVSRVRGTQVLDKYETAKFWAGGWEMPSRGIILRPRSPVNALEGVLSRGQPSLQGNLLPTSLSFYMTLFL